MPKFLEKTWTDTRPKSAKGSGIAEAIKDWGKHCPDSLDSLVDIKKLKNAVDTADQFLAAIKKAEGKLAGDKSKDSDTVNKIGATRTLLQRWKTDVTKYKGDVEEFQKEQMRSQGEAIRKDLEEKAYAKSLADAQAEFQQQVKNNLENVLAKMPTSKTEFEAALKIRDLSVAGAKFDVYRKRVSEGIDNSDPRKIDKTRKNIAGRYKVDPRELDLPREFEDLKRRFLALDRQEDAMGDALQQLADEIAAEESEPTGKNDPAYKKAIAEAFDGYKKIAAGVKAKVLSAQQVLTAAKRISALPTTVPPEQEAKVTEACRKANERIFQDQQGVVDLLSLTRNTSSPLRKKVVDAGITPEDDQKILSPQTNVAYSANKKFLGLTAQSKELIGDYLERLTEANPTFTLAAAELNNMATKYKIDTKLG